MQNNDKFFEVIKEGWKGSIEFPKEKINKKQKNISTGIIRSLVVFLGDIEGALAAYSLSGEEIPERISAKFKVIDEGICIRIKPDKNRRKKKKSEKILLAWENILRIYESRDNIGIDVLIKMKNGMEIIFSAPYNIGFLYDDYFLREFVSFVNKRVHDEMKKE